MAESGSEEQASNEEHKQDTGASTENAATQGMEGETAKAGAISDASPSTASASSAGTAAKIPPAVGNATEPNKRLSDAEPEELVHALKQVFTGSEERAQASSSVAGARQPAVRAVILKSEKEQESRPGEGEAKSGYTNPFALFADVFYGVLIAPRQTLAILSDCKKFPPTAANLFLTFVLVFGVLCLPAAIKVGANEWSMMGWLKAIAFVSGNLINWLLLSVILYYLSIWLRGNKLTLGNACIATGWAYLPFAFFAPVACFKGALGGGFTAFACLPALWFLALEWFAFQISLRTSAIKLALIALVVPPVFCLVYFFWIGLALCSLLAQLLSHLT